ncbi:chemotaxis protein CheW [Enterococcus cecorum]|nr:chemotaxis protein CheW [Enterococcus cecorum]NLL32016.1 chemotaxis protein CheW [Enterococcus cecorum]CAI3320698.1 chemotaxis protein CheW [Enterococcus cecorum]CAI3443459.1 chemotaxis protein CheW [Enterococcus cecorum]
MEQYVIFKSHSQLFAIRVMDVDRVIEARNFIHLPEVEEHILGVYEYQESMVPIIDIRKKLFREYSDHKEDAKVILCQWKGRLLGLFVEDIKGIYYLEETNYEQDLIRSSLKQSYIEKFLKLDDEVVMLLDLNYLFSSTDFDQVQDLTEGESDVIESE